MTSPHAFQLMNALGKLGEPFLFIFDFELLKPIVLPLFELKNSAKILFDINGHRNFTPLSIKPEKRFFFNKKPVSFADYKAKFDFVVKLTKNELPYWIFLTTKSNFVL